jgi:hypothetical protein
MALRALLCRSRAERELDEELRHHIEQQTEQSIRLGMSPDEARFAARRAFGRVEQANVLAGSAAETGGMMTQYWGRSRDQDRRAPGVVRPRYDRTDTQKTRLAGLRCPLNRRLA